MALRFQIIIVGRDEQGRAFMSSGADALLSETTNEDSATLLQKILNNIRSLYPTDSTIENQWNQNV